MMSPGVARERLVRTISCVVLILGLALVVAGQMGLGPLKPA